MLKPLYYKVKRYLPRGGKPAGFEARSLYRLRTNKSMSKPVQFKLKPTVLVRGFKLEPVLVQ